MNELQILLIAAALLFCLGLMAVLLRRNAVLILIGIELMLNGANLNFIAFWRYGPAGDAATGVLIVLFAIAVAAAEAAVGLAIIVRVHRHLRTASIDKLTALHG
jgi:NADH:ubiquinone oxidoreductase subunit K